jgi:hypothetical protein
MIDIFKNLKRCINYMNILCTICMRGGSRGVRNKNLIKISNEKK